MGLTITKERETKEFDEYFIDYPGYRFPCDAEGIITESALQPIAQQSLKDCRAEHGAGEFITLHRAIKHPAEGKCECGRTLYLRDDQACECGRMYNLFGQEITRLGYEDLPGEDY